IVAATNDAASRDALYRTIANPDIVVVGQTVCIPQGATTAATPAPTRAASTATPASTSVFATPTATDTASANGGGALAPTGAISGTEEFDPELLTVDYLRNYPVEASPITIVQTLEPGVNYNRYLTTYESDGYTIYAYLTVPQGTQPA